MNLNVTQQNLYLFLPGLVGNAACIMAEHNRTSVIDSLRQFYLSPTYQQLENESTKMWHLGPVDLSAPFCQ